ncbi:MAG: hypothetical protein WA959_14990 [Rivularia sp. (in: cyanobacteria)]|jgi:hypothetical protein
MNLRNKTLARIAFAGLALIGLSAAPSQAQTTGGKPTKQQQMHQNHQMMKKMTPEQMRQHQQQMMKKMTPEQMRQHQQMMKKNSNPQKPQQMKHKM